MTEAEWLKGDDPDAIIQWVTANATARLRVLTEVAQCWRLGSQITPDLGRVLDAREQVANGQGMEAGLRQFLPLLDEATVKARRNLDRADREYEQATRSRPGGHPDDSPYPTAPLFVGAEILRARQTQEEAAVVAIAVEAVRVAAFGPEDELTPLARLRNLLDEVGEHQAVASAHAELAANWENRAEEMAEQFGRYPRRKRQMAAEAQEWADRGSHILDGMLDKRVRDAAAHSRRGFVRTVHDLFGNPFRPVAFDSRWKTADVIGLARGIYEDRAFERMPLLADALMDAGCADNRVIAHCREAGSHYRGCWVVDAVLGNEPTAIAREAATR